MLLTQSLFTKVLSSSFNIMPHHAKLVLGILKDHEINSVDVS